MPIALMIDRIFTDNQTVGMHPWHSYITYTTPWFLHCNMPSLPCLTLQYVPNCTYSTHVNLFFLLLIFYSIFLFPSLTRMQSCCVSTYPWILNVGIGLSTTAAIEWQVSHQTFHLLPPRQRTGDKNYLGSPISLSILHHHIPTRTNREIDPGSIPHPTMHTLCPLAVFD
ncbi:hypothetical protein F5X99DRAFT_57954 [Biscogniauxia marginata]|nr:hypothetical protein F5X99DRAFT_57954 [Biscogniauxia marginata]